mmetsp:Transcript_14648/g.35816  ORF Transcript_14648/g.35816 Transcript_14648/m.35816 type:complete len:190 (-) Transcript_14648:1698-2267(-)
MCKEALESELGALRATLVNSDTSAVEDVAPMKRNSSSRSILDETPCPVCHDKGGSNDFLLCDGKKCQNGGHFQCLELPCIPSGKWFCTSCATAQPGRGRGRRPGRPSGSLGKKGRKREKADTKAKGKGEMGGDKAKAGTKNKNVLLLEASSDDSSEEKSDADEDSDSDSDLGEEEEEEEERHRHAEQWI